MGDLSPVQPIQLDTLLSHRAIPRIVGNTARSSAHWLVTPRDADDLEIWLIRSDVPQAVSNPAHESSAEWQVAVSPIAWEQTVENEVHPPAPPLNEEFFDFEESVIPGHYTSYLPPGYVMPPFHKA